MDKIALYGSITVSDIFGNGMSEYVFMILSGHSSRIFEMRSIHIPEPVPLPRELKFLKTIAVLTFLPHNVQHDIH
jgi:hypothetical protein